MNNSWGFNLQDKDYKSSKELIQYLVKAAGYNSNFLLNVGPMPNGKFQPEFIDTLKVLGKWMSEFGETIYGTRQGPILPNSWGVSTQKDNRIFLHVLNDENGKILLPVLDKKIGQVRLYHNKDVVPFAESKLGTIISIPENLSMPDIVLEVTLK
jgi:alpha-L-fucosidase